MEGPQCDMARHRIRPWQSQDVPASDDADPISFCSEASLLKTSFMGRDERPFKIHDLEQFCDGFRPNEA